MTPYERAARLEALAGVDVQCVCVEVELHGAHELPARGIASAAAVPRR